MTTTQTTFDSANPDAPEADLGGAVGCATLLGDLQRELVGLGYRLRLYVPYGDAWYPYFMRRLAERPANLWFVARNLLRA